MNGAVVNSLTGCHFGCARFLPFDTSHQGPIARPTVLRMATVAPGVEREAKDGRLPRPVSIPENTRAAY